MKLWRDWFPDLLPDVAGCPNVLAKHHLRRAAQTFLEKTRAWRVLLDPVPVLANASEIEVKPTDAAMELVRVESVYLGTQKLKPETIETLEATMGDDWTEHKGKPERYIQLRPGFVILYPAPEVDYPEGLSVRASVCPSDTATGLPDDIAYRYWDEIHMGAKSRLMLMPKKKWTDFTLGAALGQAFQSMVDKANVDAARAFGKARIPAKVKWC